MKILHLIVDHQVIERTLGIYETVFPQSNEILIFDWKPKDPIKHLGKYKNRPIVKHNDGANYGEKYNFAGITHIIAHYLTMDMIDFIKCAPQDIHVCWEIYGADLYNQFLVDYGYDIYHTSPKKYSKYSILETYFGPIFKALLYLKGVKYVYPRQRKKQFEYICNRVNSLQYCCKYDAHLVCDLAKRSIPSYEVFNYSLSEVLGNIKGHDYSEGTNIMIGNSASYSNNHLYVLKILRDVVLPEGCKLVMPLSYGGSSRYIRDVITNYDNAFNNRTHYIREYMPLNQYNQIFLDLSTMIMSAWRQESMGTIIMGLYLGIKVYMSEKSPLYKFLKNCGFIIFPVEYINSDSLLEKLTVEQKRVNRDLVIKRYDENVFENSLKNNII